MASRRQLEKRFHCYRKLTRRDCDGNECNIAPLHRSAATDRERERGEQSSSRPLFILRRYYYCYYFSSILVPFWFHSGSIFILFRGVLGPCSSSASLGSLFPYFWWLLVLLVSSHGGAGKENGNKSPASCGCSLHLEMELKRTNISKRKRKREKRRLSVGQRRRRRRRRRRGDDRIVALIISSLKSASFIRTRPTLASRLLSLLSLQLSIIWDEIGITSRVFLRLSPTNKWNMASNQIKCPIRCNQIRCNEMESNRSNRK